jgi:2,4-dienoyl-CoA reductase-like NADH-dependent reductase (Old Yellow Enzyme family)
MNAYDGIPFPYGFGSSTDESEEFDLKEPKQVMSRLIDRGCFLFNITAGIPYLFPHLGRPFDRPLPEAPVPSEHPLEGVSRLLSLAAALQKEFPDVPVVGTGYSWLRQHFPYVGAAVLQKDEAAFIGLGRSAFAYPEAPKDLMDKGFLDPKKVCITCSRCTELMRLGGSAGCVMRDTEIYGKQYKKHLQERAKR